MSAKETSGSADFGFRRVAAEDKAGLVRGVFDRVAARYDLMNDLMSGGIHRLWKGELVDRLNPRAGEVVLDIAGGTGDVAQGILRRRPEIGRILVCDINRAMLEIGRDRAIDAGILSGIEWLAGDAECLPIAAASIDACTIAFGLRNVTDLATALAEARRVLKPGGRFFCLEFSRPASPFLAPLYDLYSFQIVPRLGRLVVGDGEPYRYLVESIRRFPPQEELVRLMEQAGFDRVRFRNLTGGIAALHWGWRL